MYYSPNTTTPTEPTTTTTPSQAGAFCNTANPRQPHDTNILTKVLHHLVAAILGVFIIGSYLGNIFLLTKCAFKQDFKAETIRALGIFLPQVGINDTPKPTE